MSKQQERWIVSYADLVTLLFALFAVLFAVNKIQKQSETTLLAFEVDNAFEDMIENPPLLTYIIPKVAKAWFYSRYYEPATYSYTKFRHDVELTLSSYIKHHDVELKWSQHSHLMLLMKSQEDKKVVQILQRLQYILQNYAFKSNFKVLYHLPKKRYKEIPAMVLSSTKAYEQFVQMNKFNVKDIVFTQAFVTERDATHKHYYVLNIHQVRSKRLIKVPYRLYWLNQDYQPQSYMRMKPEVIKVTLERGIKYKKRLIRAEETTRSVLVYQN